MFRGDSAELREVLRRALGSARDLGQPRAGSEHLLLALAQDGPSAGILARHGATPVTIRNAVAAASPAGAGAAADAALLAVLGLGLDGLGLDGLVSAAPLDRPAGPEPVFPLGSLVQCRPVATTVAGELTWLSRVSRRMRRASGSSDPFRGSASTCTH